MSAWTSPSSRPWAHRLAWLAVSGIVVILRWFWPPRDLDGVGAVALRDLAISLGFWLLILCAAIGMGLALLRRLSLPESDTLLALAIAVAIGLGAFGYAVFALGLLGGLGRASISVLILVASALAGPYASHAAHLAASAFRRAPDLFGRAAPAAKMAAAVAAAIGLLSFLNALAPASDYDGLMYHLVGPRRFLDQGRIVPDSDNWFTNAPFTLEMVFALGMAYGDDTFPILIHYASGLLIIGATYAAARRWLPGSGSWLSVLALLGAPALPVWATFAYVDLAWAAFEFLGLVAAVMWWQTRSRSWLSVSGVLVGLAMGTKYLGLMGAAVTGLMVVLVSYRRGWRESLEASAVFGFSAAAVASPWYLKNLLWFGNPVYPLYFGGPGWDPGRLAFLTEYLDSFGVGRKVCDYLLLPLNLYRFHAQFAAAMNRIDVPGILFPLALAYPFLRRKPAAVSLLLAAGLGRTILWAMGSQQTRFLLPVFPVLALASGQVLAAWNSAPTRSRLWRLLPGALAVGAASASLFYQIVMLVQDHAVDVVLGLESKRAYLTRTVWDFSTTMDALERLEEGERLLLVGDGRGYYCLPACIPDPDHFRWAAEIAALEDEQGLIGWFAERGVSHVMLSLQDLDFLLQHDDPEKTMQRAIDRLVEWRQSGCLTEVYADEWALVYQVACH